MFKIKFRPAFGRAAVAFACGLGFSVAQAATITVNSTGDDADLADDVPTEVCGNPLQPDTTCTLRAAIEVANKTAEADTIVFDASIVPATITLTSSLPAITQLLSIDAAGQSVTVDGAGSFAIFAVTGPAGSYSFADLTVVNGVSGTSGGGIRFAPTTGSSLSVSGVTLQGNAATGNGGAIASADAGNDVLITGSTIGRDAEGNGNGNSAGNHGGGLFVAGPLTLSDSHLGANAATGDGGGLHLNNPTGESSAISRVNFDANTATGDGGGLWIDNDAGRSSLQLSDSGFADGTAANGGGIYVSSGSFGAVRVTLANNSATVNGGAVFLADGAPDGGIALDNCTISGNSAVQGGGIFADANNSSASQMRHCTVVENTASGASRGGGLDLGAPNSVFTGASSTSRFTSNLVEGNTPRDCFIGFAHSNTTFSGFNTRGDGTCTFGQASDVASGAGPNFRDLGDYAGLTPTRALTPASVAIDAGNPLSGLSADQRGASRTDGDNDGSSAPDIGAYEFGGFGAVQFTGGSFEVDEDNSPGQLTVERFGQAGVAVSVSADVDAADPGTATADVDYDDEDPVTLSWVAGEGGTKTFSIPIIDDSEDPRENDETINTLLATNEANKGVDLGAVSTAVLTIKDIEEGTVNLQSERTEVVDPGPPPVTIHVSDFDENAGTFDVIVERVPSAANDRDIVVDYSFSDITATFGPASNPDADYTTADGSMTGQFTFADGGATTQTITLTVHDDTAFEDADTSTAASDAERFKITITATPSGRLGSPSELTLEIDDNDDPVTGTVEFTATEFEFSEGDGTVAITAERVGGTDRVLQVNLASGNDNDTAVEGLGGDFDLPDQAANRVFRWEHGEAGQKTVSIDILDDAARESTENATLSLAEARVGDDEVAFTLDPAAADATLIINSDEGPRFHFANATESVAEPASGFTTVTLSVELDDAPQSGGPVTIGYRAVDGTATEAGGDYQFAEADPAQRVLTFNDGDSGPQTIDVQVNADAAEAAETFSVELFDPTGGAELVTPSSVEITIEGAPTVTLSADAFSSTDESGEINFLVRREGPSNTEVTVTWEVTEGTASSSGSIGPGDDYLPLGTNSGSTTRGTITFAADGENEQAITVLVLGDTEIEADETFSVALLADPAPTGGVLGNITSATGTILDDDVNFEFEVTNPAAITEGGTVDLKILRVGTDREAESVTFESSDNTAEAGSDYNAIPQTTVSFAVGETEKTVTVTSLDDDFAENQEGLFVDITATSATGTRAAGFGKRATVTLDDNDTAAVNVSPASIDVIEGDPGVDYTISITSDPQPGKDITVDLTVPAGLTTSVASVTFSNGDFPGNLSRTITVSADENNSVDGDRVQTISHAVSTADPVYAAITPADLSVNVEDNDAFVNWKLVNVSADEDDGAGGSTTATLVATRDGGLSRTASIQFATSEGGATPATSDVDFSGSSGLATFASGAADSSPVVINLTVDRFAENDETFLVTLSDPSGNLALGTDTVATVTITDNDPAGFTFTRVEPFELIEGDASATYTVSIDSQPQNGQPVTVSITQTPDAADNGPEVTVTDTLSFDFASWTETQELTVTVTAPNDAVITADRAPTIAHTSSSADPFYDGFDLSGQDFVATVREDDAELQLSVDNATPGEADGNVTFTITRVGSTVGQIDFDFRSDDGSATAGSDYTDNDGSGLLADGETMATQTVAITADGLDESDENFAFTLENPSNATLANATTTVAAPASLDVTIVDDDTASVTMDPTAFTVAEDGETEQIVNVTLGSTPAGDITIDFSGFDTANLTVTPNPLVIAGGSTSGAVTVKAIDDDLDEADTHTTTITAAASSSDPLDAPYDGLGGDLTANVTDNDTVGVTVTAVDAEVTEASAGEAAEGDTGSYTVVLSSEPTADVVVDVTAGADVSVSPASLTFTSANWDQAQTVTVTAVDDRLVEDLVETASITHAASSGDAAYDGFAVAGVDITVNDDDAFVNFTADVVTTSIDPEDNGVDAGTTISLTVERSRATANGASFNFFSTGGTATDGVDYDSLAGGLITINAGETSATATIDVSSVFDELAEGDENFTVTVEPFDNDSSNLVAGADAVSTITIVDNDIAGVSIDVGDGVAVTEGDTTDTYTVVLDTRPTSDVTVTITGDADAGVSPSTLTFVASESAGNAWNIPQTVTVSAVDDAEVEGAETATITATTDSADANYAAGAIAVANVSAAVTDNDALVNFAVATDSANEDAGTITVEVTRTGSTNQSGQVEFTLSGTATDGSDYTVTTTSPITFAAASASETISIDISNDDLAEAAEDIVLTLAIAAGSENVVQLGATTQATRTIVDNDTVGVTVTVVDTEVTEASAGEAAEGDTGSYTVVLSSEPTADVVVDVTAGADVSVSPASLTFTSANWDQAQTVTVTAVDDRLVEDLVETASITHAASSGDAAYDGFAVAGVDITVNDDDAFVNFTADVVTTSIDPEDNGVDAGTTISLTVERSRATANGASFNFFSTGGTATDGVDYDSLAGGLITINAGETSATATIDVSSVFDELAEGDENFTVTVEPFDNDSSNLVAGADAVSTITIVDNDIAGVSIDVGDGVAVTEGDTTDTYTVVLDTRPTSDVTVTITGDADAGVSPSTLTFVASESAGNAWNIPQTVTVSAVDDAEVEGAETATITATTDSADANYAAGAIAVANVSAAVTDNDALVNFAVATDSANEDAGTITVEVTRTGSTNQSGQVEFTLSGTATDGSDYTVTTTSPITFAAASASETISIDISNDDLAEAAEDIVLTLAIAAGSENVVQLGATTQATRTIVDNDVPGLSLDLGDGLAVTEAGAADSFTVVLNTEPTADVTVTITGDADAGVDPTALTFTASGGATPWDVPQTVDVTAIDDAIVEPNETATLSIDVDSADADYAAGSLSVDDISVAVSDDDQPSITIDPVSFDQTEGAAATTVTVTLDAPPISDVTITLAADAGLTLSTTTLVLNADTPSGTVDVSADDDNEVTGDRSLAVTTTVSAGEGNRYDGSAADDLAVNVIEDDVAGISVSPLNLSVTENGDTAEFTVTLNTVPSDPVTVPLSAGALVVLSTSQVVLDANTPSATVMVQAVDDNVINGTRAETVSVEAAQSADADYQGIDAADVSVEVNDDDVADVTVSPTELTIAEGGAGSAVTVTLATAPSAPVTIALTPSADVNLTDGAGTPITQLVLDAGNPTASFTVVAVDDSVDLAERSANVALEPAQSADANYAGFDAADVAVTITDDTDVAGFIITETDAGTAVSEGGLTDTYTVVLNTQPLDEVTVAIAASGGASVDSASLVFTPGNWDQPQTVTVSAVNNAEIDDPPRVASLRHRVSSSDAAYAALDDQTLSVSVADNDSALRIVNSALTVGETATVVTVLVERIGSLEGSIAFSFGTADGTALAGEDYVAISGGQGSFANGEGGTFAIEVTLQDDLEAEGEEVFFLQLLSASNGGNGETEIFIPSEAAIVILDNEAPPAAGSGSLGGLSLAGLLFAAAWRRRRTL